MQLSYDINYQKSGNIGSSMFIGRWKIIFQCLEYIWQSLCQKGEETTKYYLFLLEDQRALKSYRLSLSFFKKVKSVKRLTTLS